MKEYLELKGNAKNCTHLKVEVYYDLGGMNYFTGRGERRGYYLSVCPVERTERNGFISEGYTAFTGNKVLLKEVPRKSKKAELEAYRTAEEVNNYYIDKVLKKNGLELA